ncbi:nucleotide exchange factor GrpE [Facilibium subflavum]|uniref:nucleotide exchange factor GrpE n=1 Tax=Facilibium subflavum TaxID=2219058 RepID=UPI000E65354C|nr:nucleotide exchange factor GrpE [Facilibium subflavum]
MSKPKKEELETLETENTVDQAGDVTKLKAEVDVLKAKLSNAEEKVHEAKEESLRALAEMENTRRRAQKDVGNAHKYALEKFADALLPVLDSMEKAVETANTSEDIKAMAEGVSLTQKMLLDTMDKFGIVQINPVGESFDPNKHEAMAMQPNPEMKDNQVMSVFQKGYALNNRVVRPARVLVVKNN